MTPIESEEQSVARRDRLTLVVVDDHEAARHTVANALRRRFGLDYDVVEAANPQKALDELERLSAAGVDIPLIVANQYMTAEAGPSFLAKTRTAYPAARRLTLAAWGDNGVMPAIAHASTLGQIDHVGFMPWGESDERFLASVGNILADWNAENGRGGGGMTIVGTPGDPDYQLLADVLQRWNTEPVTLLEAGSSEADRFLAERSITGAPPILVVADGRVLTEATLAKVSDAVGAGIDTRSTIFDVVVIGLGPAGLSAAVNAASEGLRVLLLDSAFSQASSSPMIRNYLGFPEGVSGAELMRRAWWQALMFGAVGRIGRSVTAIRREGDTNVLLLDDGAEVATGTVILATGVNYRRIGIDSVDRLVGRGVFYGYGASDALAMTGADVAVVGGANSAAQGAAHMARHARSVRLLVRGASLGETASDYLVEQLQALPNVTINLNSEVVDAKNTQQLRSITIRDRATRQEVEEDVAGLFVMIGAVPRTDWLPLDLARDKDDFIQTGEDGPPVEWPSRLRLPYETTLPGVFAIGDVRAGSVKRVAAAVGEGSAVVQQVLRYRSLIAQKSDANRLRSGEPMAVAGA